MSPTPFQQAMAEAAMRPMNVQAQLARFERQKEAIENANRYNVQPTEGVYQSLRQGVAPQPAKDFISELNEHFGSPARSETALPSMVAYDELMAGNKAIADKFEELRRSPNISDEITESIIDRLREEANEQYMQAVKDAINRRISEGGITREDLPGVYGVPYDLQADISDKHPLGYRYKRQKVNRATSDYPEMYERVAANVLGRPPTSFDRYNLERPFPASIGQHVADANMQQREQLAQDMGYSDRYDMPPEVYDAYMKRRDAMEAPPTQEELSDIFSYLQTPPKPQYTPPPQTEFERFGRPLSNVQTGEPMDLAFRMLKERKSPEAMRHKLEYDKQYESSPERVKYRTELNRERRRRGIMGSRDHKDVSHTQGGRLTLESEHDNRARHFKNRGTLRQIDEVK